MKKTSMANPLGVLPVDPTVTTTKVEEDINGRPLGLLSAGLAAAPTEDEEDVDGRSDSGHHRG
jgi:hypothetical protein